MAEIADQTVRNIDRRMRNAAQGDPQRDARYRLIQPHGGSFNACSVEHDFFPTAGERQPRFTQRVPSSGILVSQSRSKARR